MGYAMYFVKAGLLSIGGSYLEVIIFHSSRMVDHHCPCWKKAFSLVIFSMAAYAFWLFMHGMGVGSARENLWKKQRKMVKKM